MEPQDRDELNNLRRKLAKLERNFQTKHEENIARFAEIEKAAAKVDGELKIVILLLIAQLGTNIAHLFGA